jgi:SAM-dependent methyltransferase
LGFPDETVFRHVDFIIGEFGASEGSSLIDAGCGQGRYSLAFAARGFHVTGLDASEILLNQARVLESDMAARVRWVLGDMRRPPATDTYQYGVLLDAFGFFEPDATPSPRSKTSSPEMVFARDICMAICSVSAFLKRTLGRSSCSANASPTPNKLRIVAARATKPKKRRKVSGRGKIRG